MSPRTRRILLAILVALLGATRSPSEEVCTDAKDDDMDGRIDCADPDCDHDPACAGGLRENCSNRVDDDADGRIDCNDLDCIHSTDCSDPPEFCHDTRDNDGDGRVDCADSDCCADPACVALGCTPFKRGDVDGDGRRTITDAIRILVVLFGGGSPLSCSDAADLDDGDTVDIADPIYLLVYIFQGGPEPPPPFLQCGKDPTQGSMDCDRGFRCA